MIETHQVLHFYESEMNDNFSHARRFWHHDLAGPFPH